MNYAEYKKRGFPLENGNTEAARKPIVTQRFKLSGISRKPKGVQTIMNLRVILLSGVWYEAYQLLLKRSAITKVGDQGTSTVKTVQIAAKLAQMGDRTHQNTLNELVDFDQVPWSFSEFEHLEPTDFTVEDCPDSKMVDNYLKLQEENKSAT